MEKRFKLITSFYIILFFGVTLIFLMQVPADYVMGEWDDYAVTTASLMNDHNYTISRGDVIYFANLFPKWLSEWEIAANMSGFTARDGNLMPWYAPTYSAWVIPFVYLTKAVKISTAYSFRLANFAVLLIAVLVVYKKARMKGGTKLLLIAALTANPVVLLLKWQSAEVFIYSLLTMSVIFWLNQKFCKAALFGALAATMNPVILFWGLVMIGSYFANLAAQKNNFQRWPKYYAEKWKEIFLYGCCYIVAILPLLYNYYQVGHFNLSASAMADADGAEVLKRFLAYMFDLNFGMLPYFGVIMLLGIIVISIAVMYRKWKYILLFLTFLGIGAGYSVASHINCGMDAIARYNAWNAVFLITLVFYGIDELLTGQKKRVVSVLAAAGIVLAAGVTGISRTSTYVYLLPVAGYVLDHIPALYNPLPSTFNSRVNHIDGGYDYQCPVVYRDAAGNIRKILVDEGSVEYVKANIRGDKEDINWMEKQLDKVEKEQYISVGKKHQIQWQGE